ncbi:sensor histidine kinase [Rugosimonospora africana]|uniref:histidine kinase n=1 Tax=Rugosimonospora africana TaxID=556532 RepID=A0A8J3QSJ1_9ACTN|nr:histidine kinase [Rugosimonospora africana]GIH16650.1 two-component sensor histidine kinase [Rugosimonospora africana]
MGAVTLVRQASRLHPYVFDAIVALCLFAISVSYPLLGPLGGEGRLTPGQAAFSAVVWGVLVLRRRHPLAVLSVSSAATALSVALNEARGLSTLAVVIAVYTVAVSTNRLTAVLAGSFTGLVLVGGALYSTRGTVLDPDKVVLVLWSGLAAAVGDAIRSHRDYVLAAEERARRAEHSRDEQTRRRLAEDRLRIARDLHDVMAHHIAVINVQAGVAGHVLRSDPSGAQEALGHVRHASRAVLDELGSVLRVLRENEEVAAPTEPVPGLGRMEELIESFRGAGLRVTWRRAGQIYALPAPVDLAAYRLLQESLTNAHKHGGDIVRIQLSYQPEQLTVEVDNEAPAERRRIRSMVSTGYGLLGMRERVSAAGGRMHAGPRPGGGFRVRAVLPACQERG